MFSDFCFGFVLQAEQRLSETLGVYKKTWPSQAWIVEPELTKHNIGAIKSDVKSVTLIKLEFLLAKALSSKPQDMLS